MEAYILLFLEKHHVFLSIYKMKAAKGEKFVDPFKKLTVKEIEKRLEAMSLQERENYLSVLLNDPRKSVKAIDVNERK